MSDKYIKEITQNIPNNELNAAYDALMNSNLNKTSDYEEVSMEELNEYIEGLECQAEDLRTQLAKVNERLKELEKELKESEDALNAAEQQLSSYENALEEVQAVFVNSDACPLFEPFNPRNLSAWLNKFAIEKKREGYYDSCIESGMNGGQADLLSDIYAEQLRKEQE